MAGNEDIRTEVEIIGITVFALFVLLGFFFTYIAFCEYRREKSNRWKQSVIIGLAFNIFLTSLVTALAYESYVAKHPSRPVGTHHETHPLTAATSDTKRPVWIDTDPGCGVEKTADVDDCWALLAALRSPELHVVGVSTVFGNQPGEWLEEFVRDILPTIGEGHTAAQSQRHPPRALHRLRDIDLAVFSGSPGRQA